MYAKTSSGLRLISMLSTIVLMCTILPPLAVRVKRRSVACRRVSERGEDPLEDRAWLRTQDELTPVENKRGNTRDADRLRLTGRAEHDVSEVVAPEHARHLVVVEADLGGEHLQLVRVADVGRLLPVREHQPIVERLVEVARACELGETQRPHRVRDDLGRRVVDEAERRERVAQALDVAVAVPGVELSPRDAL